MRLEQTLFIELGLVKLLCNWSYLFANRARKFFFARIHLLKHFDNQEFELIFRDLIVAILVKFVQNCCHIVVCRLRNAHLCSYVSKDNAQLLAVNLARAVIVNCSESHVANYANLVLHPKNIFELLA